MIIVKDIFWNKKNESQIKTSLPKSKTVLD